MDDGPTHSGMSVPGTPCKGQDGTSVKRELYRNATGHEVWRIYEERPDGSFLVLHEDVASDHDAAWMMDAARHGGDKADRLESERFKSFDAQHPRSCLPVQPVKPVPCSAER